MDKTRYRELKEPCKSCLGCMRLEDPNFTGDSNCRYRPIAEESIRKINEIFGIQVNLDGI